MATTHLQFHCLPDEAAGLFAAWTEGLSGTLAAETFFPEYAVHELRRDDGWAQAVTGGLSVDRLNLVVGGIRQPVDRSTDFLRRHPDALRLTLPISNEEGLREASLDGCSTSPEVAQMWRTALTRAKRSLTRAPVTLTLPFTGATDSVLRYHSRGVRESAAGGLRLLAIAGNGQFQLQNDPR
ncbi:hypothetical protein [Angustibacter luteus]|uniref:Uncharacterized protein n=1 Tax=Angustibacter luteus TaxID=658456 RepID=A0ABW1JBZ1_9ACTN